VRPGFARDEAAVERYQTTTALERGVCKLKQVDGLIITEMMNNANGQRDIDFGYSFERTPRDAPAVWVRVDPGSDLRDELAWIARAAGEPLRLKTSVHDVRT